MQVGHVCGERKTEVITNKQDQRYKKEYGAITKKTVEGDKGKEKVEPTREEEKQISEQENNQNEWQIVNTKAGKKYSMGTNILGSTSQQHEKGVDLESK